VDVNWTLVIIGLCVAFSPLSLIVFFVLLATERGLAKGAAFIAGWMSCLVVIEVSILVLTDGRPPRESSTPGTLLTIGLIIVGLGLLVIARQQFVKYRRGAPVNPKQAALLRRLDTMSLWSAAAVGVLIQPWPFVAGGAASVAEVDLDSVSAWIWLGVYTVIATSAMIAAEIYVAIRKDTALPRLASIRSFLEKHQRVVVFVLAGAIGALLVARGGLLLAGG
jgi:hypothetical protein